LHNGLLYHINVDRIRRLCIPEKLIPTILGQAHDAKHHFGENRMCRDLCNVRIHRLSKRVEEYIRACRECAVNQTDRKPPLGNYQPTQTHPEPMHTLGLDWIVGMPPVPSDGTPWALPNFPFFDTLLTVTCKFSKRTLLIPGHSTYSAEHWGEVVARTLMLCDWGMPKALISDRDRRFHADFWRGLWKSFGTRICMTAAYHSQANGLAERKNQTVEIAIRFFYAEHPDETLVVSPDNRSRQEINQFIHRELQSGGKVEKQEYRLTVLVPRQEMTGADRQWAAQYDAGDLVRYTRGSETLGVKAGEYVCVTGVDREHIVVGRKGAGADMDRR